MLYGIGNPAGIGKGTGLWPGGRDREGSGLGVSRLRTSIDNIGKQLFCKPFCLFRFTAMTLVHGGVCVLVNYLVLRIFGGSFNTAAFLFIFQMIYLSVGESEDIHRFPWCHTITKE